jgi:hypothetical protein
MSSRAVPRQGRRPPHRHLLLRRHALRDGDRDGALQGRQHSLPPRPHAAALDPRGCGRTCPRASRPSSNAVSRRIRRSASSPRGRSWPRCAGRSPDPSSAEAGRFPDCASIVRRSAHATLRGACGRSGTVARGGAVQQTTIARNRPLARSRAARRGARRRRGAACASGHGTRLRRARSRRGARLRDPGSTRGRPLDHAGDDARGRRSHERLQRARRARASAPSNTCSPRSSHWASTMRGSRSAGARSRCSTAVRRPSRPDSGGPVCGRSAPRDASWRSRACSRSRKATGGSASRRGMAHDRLRDRFRPSVHRPSDVFYCCPRGRALRGRARAGADLRIRPRGRGVACDGAGTVRRLRQHARARGRRPAESGGTPLSRRVRAPQSRRPARGPGVGRAELHAHVTVEKGGHGLHHALVRALVEQPGLAVAREAPEAERERRAGAQPG